MVAIVASASFSPNSRLYDVRDLGRSEGEDPGKGWVWALPGVIVPDLL